MKVMKILFFIVLNKNFIIPIYYDFDFESYLGWVPPPKQKKEREKKKKKPPTEGVGGGLHIDFHNLRK